jgi:hypothetical protein
MTASVFDSECVQCSRWLTGFFGLGESDSPQLALFRTGNVVNGTGGIVVSWVVTLSAAVIPVVLFFSALQGVPG